MKRTDELVTWGGLHGTGNARVRVRVFDDMVFIGRSIVILTEPEDNPGTSVTNGVDLLAPLVCERFGLDERNITFVEHYDARSGRPSSPATFDVVTFGGAIETTRDGRDRWAGPNWSRLEWPVLRNSIADGIGKGSDWKAPDDIDEL